MVHQAEIPRLFCRHVGIAFQLTLNGVNGLACMVHVNLIKPLTQIENFARLDFNIGSLSARASAGLMRAGAGGVVALILQVVAPVGLAALHGQPLWPALNANMFDLTVMMFASGLLMIGSALEAAARRAAGR